MNGLCDSVFTTADKRLGVSHLTLYFYIDLLHALVFFHLFVYELIKFNWSKRLSNTARVNWSLSGWKWKKCQPLLGKRKIAPWNVRQPQRCILTVKYIQLIILYIGYLLEKTGWVRIWFRSSDFWQTYAFWT